MKEIAWTMDLSVGIELIDEQHKMLIKHLSDLNESLQSGKGPTKIASTLNFLIEYTNFHFSAEEKHMAANDYPELENHKKMHEGFKTTLSNLEEELEEEGATKMLADSIDTLLVKWLFEHIREIDVAFGKYLKEKGIEIPNED
ncbi:MAG: hemerythrin family protein [Desulfobacteraceae bacterium]|nr:hemerythrin family protein [Desulfobacteraceae bacterium]